ncbi:MAG: tetratricopeptide repeat protein [Polyangiales bacterium]
MRYRALTLLALSLLARSALAQEGALPALKEAAKQAPSSLEAQAALGRALVKAGRLKEADAQMAVIARLSKGSIEALYESMQARLAGDNYAKARAGCQELIKKDENAVLSQVCMARAFLVWRRSSRAFEHIDKALARDPESYDALLVLADARRIQGEHDAAVEAYEHALRVRPTSAEAELGLGLSLALQNKPADALAALRKANQLDPSDPDVQFELGTRLQGKDAVSLLQQAVAGRPGWAQAELALAMAELQAGDAASAEALLQAFLKRNPKDPIAIAHHGAALVGLGRYQDAEPVLRKALEAVPNDYDTSFALAQLYEHTNRYEEAFSQYRNAADLKRESPVPLIAAAKLGLSLKRPSLSSALLDKALERAPHSAEVLALSADALAARGDAKAARERYKSALKGEGPLDRAMVQKRLAELQ